MYLSMIVNDVNVRVTLACSQTELQRKFKGKNSPLNSVCEQVRVTRNRMKLLMPFLSVQIESPYSISVPYFRYTKDSLINMDIMLQADVGKKGKLIKCKEACKFPANQSMPRTLFAALS